MTVVVNGGPIIYNRTGKTIDSYNGSGTNISGSSTNIVDTGAGSIVVILQPQSSSNYACNIPSGVETGTELIIVIDTTFSSGGWFYLTGGETLIDGSTDRGSIASSASFIKVSSAEWLRLT